MRKRFVNRAISLLLTVVMLVGMVPAVVAADSAAGSFTNPFTSGTLSSTSWRIPAMVTLDDGTIVAAADARWNTTYDGGGLDTAVAYSTDNGATWTKSLENYLSDNGNVYDGGSTCFIDPALATDGSTVWMLCDLYPFGVALNGSKETTPYSGSTGFNDNGYLLLAKSDSRETSTSSYTYYLKDGKIYSSTGTEQSGYTVDADFNITGTDGTSSNLFFEDSPFKVYPTGYLYLKSSTDGGKNWSDPTLLNLKTTSENVCLVGPGRGLVTSTGRIVFPVYSYTSSAEYLSFVYSDDNGASWKRSSSLTSIDSSEAAVVELNDGTLRFFFRNHTGYLCYADAAKGATSFSGYEQTTIPANSNTQLSAITYSKTIGGDQVILLSCPTGPSGNGSSSSDGSYRTSGKLHVLTVASTNTLTLKNTVDITTEATAQLTDDGSYTEAEGFFAYSCLTEMADGSVAILYENNQYGWGAASDGSNYYTITNKAYTESELETTSVTFDSFGVFNDQNTSVTTLDKTITEGTSIEVVCTGLGITETLLLSSSDSSVATVGCSGNTVTINAISEGEATITGTVIGKSDVSTLTIGDAFTINVTVNSANSEEEDTTLEDTITTTGGGTATTYVKDVDGVDDDAQYLIVYNGNALTYDGSSFSSTTVTENNDNTLTVAEGVDISNAIWIRQENGFYNVAQQRYLYPEKNRLSSNRNEMEIDPGTYSSGYLLYCDTSERYVRYKDGWRSAKNEQDATRVELYKVTEGTASISTVDAALQEARIAALPTINDSYTDESWDAYQDALNTAQSMLIEVEAASYATEDDARSALAELVAVVDALETAYKKLEKAVTIIINYQVDGITIKTETANVSENDENYTLPSTILGTDGNTYSVDNTTLVLTGANSYNVGVTKTEFIDEITVEVQGTKSISVTLGSGQYVEWSSSDANYAGVMGVYDSTTGTYTNAGTVVGLTETADGEYIVVSGTVYNADGTEVGVYNWKVTVEADSTPATATGTKYVKVNVDPMDNVDVYYAVNGGALTKLNGTGYIIGSEGDSDDTYETYTTEQLNIMFFAAPKTGYSLTYMGYTKNEMSTSGEESQFYSLDGDLPDGTDSECWPFAVDDDKITEDAIANDNSIWKTVDSALHGWRWAIKEGNYSPAQLKLLLTQAKALGCEGGTSFTINNNNNTTSEGRWSATFHFAAQSLPVFSKVIEGITYSTTDGDTGNRTMLNDRWGIQLNDTVTYKIEINFPEMAGDGKYGILQFESMKLSDTVIFGDNSLLFGSLDNVTVEYEDPDTLARTTLSAVDGCYDLTSYAAYNSTGDSFTISLYASFSMSYNNYALLYDEGTSEASTIINKAEIAYRYKSDYVNATTSAESSAEIEAYIWYGSVVSDFALPIVIDIKQIDYFKDVKTFQSATAKYGTVELVNADNDEDGLTDTLIYTPTTVAPEYDVITYIAKPADTTITDPFSYGVYVTNASNVLYEEGYMTANTKGSGVTWVNGSKDIDAGGDGYQSSLNAAPYGYDDEYAGSTGPSGTQYVASLTSANRFSDNLTFTFTGTGFDLIGACGPATGTLMVRVDKVNADGSTAYHKGYLLDTAFIDTTYGKIYQAPILHVNDWDLAEYKVTVSGAYIIYNNVNNVLSANMSGYGGNSIADVYELMYRMGLTDAQIEDVEFINMNGRHGVSTYDTTESSENSGTNTMTLEIDGFRVYRTTTNASYQESGEIDGNTVNPAGVEYDVTYYNALDAVESATFAAYIEGKNDGAGYTVSDYESNGGAQSEIYLAPNQSVAFAVTGKTPIQVSVRSVTGTAVGFNGTEISHATEMYYAVTPSADGVVTISNTSDAGSGTLLAIGNFKCSGPSTRIMTLADYTTAFSLIASGGSEIDVPASSDDVVLVLNRQWTNSRGVQVEELPNEKVSAVYTMKNLLDTEVTITLMLAAYDIDGKMISVQMESVVLDAYERYTLTSTLSFPEDTVEVKSILLGDEMNPLCSSSSLTATRSESHY